MNEEIDIIELLKRVKEGNAPKEIEVGKSKYKFNNRYNRINELYSDDLFLWFIKNITIDTKIKILDKHIIDKLEVQKEYTENGKFYIDKFPNCEQLMDKINQIIDYINNKE